MRTEVAAERRVGGTRAPTSAHARGFDFLHGRWDVRHRKLRERLVGCLDWSEFPGTLEVGAILGGLGNFDRNALADPEGEYEAHSLRLYNPGRDEWSIWWLSSRAPGLDGPVVGGFSAARGEFFGPDLHDGRPVLARTTYEPLAPAEVEWTQAFSTDEGASWEVNWIMTFTRAGA